MKLLFVSEFTRFARSTYALRKYAEVGRALGHEVALFGEQQQDAPGIPFSVDVKRFDFAVFVVHIAADFPDLPYLARLLDGIPKDRRAVIDCGGKYNDTLRVEHDFNHLEKLDGHQGWEWVEGFEAISDRILQPTLNPLRPNVRPFLFYGFDPRSVARPHASAREAAAAWANQNGGSKEYDLVYVGNNWQRWTQVRRFLEQIAPIRGQLGRLALVGWDWAKRPDWDVQLGLHGADVDPELLRSMQVETREAIPFDQVTAFTSNARFTPVFHRPLFDHLGLVTNRTFETFCADTIPLLMLPEHMVDAIYGPDARPLAPGEEVAARVQDMLRRPERYWDAVLKTRAHLAAHHSYEQRFRELEQILRG